MNDIDINSVERKVKLSVVGAAVCALAAAFTLFIWMKRVEESLHYLNKRVETLEAKHGYAIDGATHDKHN